jgi:O-antigen ligase
MIFLIVLLLVIVIMPFLFKYVEIVFGLFLVAGFFKADTRLQSFLPEFFDLTIFFGTMVLLFILYKVVNKKLKIPCISNKLFFPYIALILLMFISLFYTKAPIYGWDKFLRFVTITTLAILGPIFLLKDIKKFHRFLYTLVFISSLMVIESIISHFGMGGGFRTAFGSNYLALGRITGIVLLAIIYYFLLRSDKLKVRFLWSLLFGLNFFGLLYSGGRAPVVAFFMTVIILGFFSIATKVKINQARIIKIAGSFILIGGMLFIFSPKPFSKLFGRINVLITQEGGGKSAARRLVLYRSATEAITEKPIQGLGIGGFSIYESGNDQRSYPHNILLEIGAEIGIIGLISFFFITGFCFSYLFKLRKTYKEPEKYYLITTILAFFIFMFFNTLVSGDINDNRLFFVWLGVTYSVGAILRKEGLLMQNKQEIDSESPKHITTYL